MYIKFPCPLCGTNTFRTSVLSDNESFSEKCRGCTQSITWVGSEWVAKTKRKGPNDSSVKIDPGVLAKLADAEPGVSIGSKEDAASLITGGTGTTEIDIYSQGERIKEFSPTDKSVQEGVCNGQSLHWIRRVLQGGRAEYKVQERKLDSQKAPELIRNPQNIVAKQRAQHMGGVVVQKATESNVLNSQLKQYSDKSYSEYKKAWDLLDEMWNAADVKYEKKMEELGGQKQPNGNWSYYINDKTKEVIDERDTVQAHVKAEQDKLTVANEARKAAGAYTHHWEKIAKDLDAKLLQASIVKKKRPFSGIVCIKSVNRETCAGGVAGFANKLLADTDFKVGACALIGAGLKIGIGEGGGEISGHAVAVHYAQSNVIRIFDPNIGVFSCTSKGGLKAALEKMLDDGWVKVFGWQLDDNFGYSLFEVKHAAVEVLPKQVAVDYAVSAETTAIQNKKVIPSPTEAPTIAPTKPQGPALIKKPVASTSSGSGADALAKGGGNDKAALRLKLTAAANDPSKFLAKRANVATADGLGYVRLDQDLCKQIIGMKIGQHPDLKGQSPMGDWLMKGTLNQIIEALK